MQFHLDLIADKSLAVKNSVRDPNGPHTVGLGLNDWGQSMKQIVDDS